MKQQPSARKVNAASRHFTRRLRLEKKFGLAVSADYFVGGGG